MKMNSRNKRLKVLAEIATYDSDDLIRPQLRLWSSSLFSAEEELHRDIVAFWRFVVREFVFLRSK